MRSVKSAPSSCSHLWHSGPLKGQSCLQWGWIQVTSPMHEEWSSFCPPGKYHGRYSLCWGGLPSDLLWKNHVSGCFLALVTSAELTPSTQLRRSAPPCQSLNCPWFSPYNMSISNNCMVNFLFVYPSLMTRLCLILGTDTIHIHFIHPTHQQAVWQWALAL